MNSRQALDYLYEVTVIEPAMADEWAEVAINTLRTRLATLRLMIEQTLDEGLDEMREILEVAVGRREKR